METFGVILLLVMAGVMSSLGAVLLVRMLGVASSFPARVILAALIGPGAMFLPVIFIVFDTATAPWMGLVPLAFMFVVAAVVIGWPVSFIATRSLIA